MTQNGVATAERSAASGEVPFSTQTAQAPTGQFVFNGPVTFLHMPAANSDIILVPIGAQDEYEFMEADDPAPKPETPIDKRIQPATSQLNRLEARWNRMPRGDKTAIIGLLALLLLIAGMLLGQATATPKAIPSPAARQSTSVADQIIFDLRAREVAKASFQTANALFEVGKNDNTVSGYRSLLSAIQEQDARPVDSMFDAAYSARLAERELVNAQTQKQAQDLPVQQRFTAQ